MQDPFASAPADEAQVSEATFNPPPAPPEPAPAQDKKAPAKKASVTVDVKPSILPAGEGKVVLTFKGGTGFDAPWIVVHATDLQDAYDQVSGDSAKTLAALMERTQQAGAHFAGLSPAGSKGAGSAQRQPAPQPAQQPPAGSPPSPGPDWTYKSGVSKMGKTWQAWMPPRGSNDKPVFF